MRWQPESFWKASPLDVIYAMRGANDASKKASGKITKEEAAQMKARLDNIRRIEDANR